MNRKETPESLTDNWELESEDFDPEVLLATIINRGASFCVLYPEPDYFKLMSDNFWKRWKNVFQNWFDLQKIEYDPIENYNRYEEWTDNGTASSTSSSEIDSSGTNTNEVSAYDSGSYSPHDKNTESSGTDTSASSSSEDSNEHEGHIHGNIGVLTTQAMLESSYDLMLKWGNLYNHIADIFIKEMLISVY